MFLYGGIGLVWAISLWGKMFSNALKIREETRQLKYILFPLFFVVTCINELHWFYDYGFAIMVIFLCMEESELDDIKGNILEVKDEII